MQTYYLGVDAYFGAGKEMKQILKITFIIKSVRRKGYLVLIKL